MIDRIVTTAGATLILLLAAAPAMAGIISKVPEPATMGLFGLGVAGAFVAKRFIRRR